jgi:soluble lytic murein transglycosylase-like protein
MLKIAAIESGGNPNAISATGAIGVFQFTGQTGTGVGIN